MPYAIYGLIACNVVMFALTGLNGGWGETDPETLFRFGSLYAPAVWQGQWWRIGSSMFLHGGILHILLNMWALRNLGTELERVYGTPRFFLVYLGAGWVGGLASLVWSGNSVGASGAIFGVAGAWLAIALRRGAYFKAFGSQILRVVVINLVIGLSLGGYVDNHAHIGGLIGGFLLGNFVPNRLPEFKATPARYAAVAALLLLFLAATPFAVRLSEHILTNAFPT